MMHEKFHSPYFTFFRRARLFFAVGLSLCVFTGANGGAAPDEKAEAPAVTYNSGPESTGAVALTFDDGPHPRLTPRLIEILKRENVPATFFMLGEQVEKFPEVAKAVATARFEIANHTYSHTQLTKLSTEKVRDEIRRTQEAIEKATGVRPRLLRPPYGATNKSVHRIAAEEGLAVVNWSIDPRDWESSKTPASITAKILKDGQGGSIVLIHDIHARSIEAVPAIIKGLRAKGLTFTTAGQLVAAEKEARKKRQEEGEKPSANPAQPAESSEPPRPVTVPLGKTSIKKKYDGSGGE